MTEIIPNNKSPRSNQNQFRSFIEMIKDHFSKSYTGLSKFAIFLMLFSIAYLVLPFDFDWFFPFGYIDDAIVIGFVLKHVKKEIDKYQTWKLNKSL